MERAMETCVQKNFILVLDCGHTEGYATLAEAKRFCFYHFKHFKELRYKETVIYNNIDVDGTGRVKLTFEH